MKQNTLFKLGGFSIIMALFAPSLINLFGKLAESNRFNIAGYIYLILALICVLAMLFSVIVAANYIILGFVSRSKKTKE